MLDGLDRRCCKRFVVVSVAWAFAFVVATAGATSAHAASPVALGTADSFAVLAGSTITNTGPTTITGDIGLCCTGSALTGFGSVTQPGGAQYVGTGTPAATAQSDLTTAYNDAAGRAVTRTLPVDLSLSGTPATPLLPGVYESTAHGVLQINTGLTLDFQGDPNAVFIFQGTTLTTAAAAAGSVNIVNGGSAPSACNIFWQLSSDATGVSLGASSAFKGTTMALGASVLGNSATVDGRILTRRSKAVALDSNTIIRSACSTMTGGGGGDGGATTTIPASGGDSTTTTAPAATPAPTLTPTRAPLLASPTVTSTIAAPIRTPAPGSARISGPSGTVSNPFSVSVTGRAIQQVTFSLDGRRIGTVRAKAGRKKFQITINPRGQSRRVHRVTARITFTTSSRTSSTTRRVTYRTRDSSITRAPRFTG